MDSRDFLAVISAKCPSYKSPLPDCPLAEYRKLQTAGENPLEKLSEEQAEALVRAHFLCVCRKEGCGT